MVATVLMTVYDPPVEMLRTAVTSVLNQTFTDFEFLILDDGSRDQSVLAELDSLAAADRRIRLFHEPHRGVPATSNRGLALARGTYIARHDADDWSEPDRLLRQVAFLDQHSEITLAGTGTWAHSSAGDPLWRLRLPQTSAEVARTLLHENPFVHGSTMFRRATALAMGGYREEFPCSSDYDFLWRLADAGSAVNLDQVLYHYRYTGGSISARRAADQARTARAAQLLAASRRTGQVEDVREALRIAENDTASEPLRASLKQADHLMLAGNFGAAGRAYFQVLASRPSSTLAWAKIARLAVFAAIPAAREVSFR